MTDKKAFDRDFPRTHCEIRTEYSSAESFLDAYMKQLGQGGLFLEKEDPPLMGTDIEVHFKLPGDRKEIRAIGTVVWRMTNSHHDIFARGIGVKFTKISEADKKRIGKFVETHNKEA